MKLNTPHAFAGVTTRNKSRFSTALVLSISMVALGSATAYAGGNPTFANLKPITVTLKGDHINGDVATYTDSTGKEIGKIGFSPSVPNSVPLEITAFNIKKGWKEQGDGLACSFPQNECVLNVVKHEKKMLVSPADFNIPTISEIETRIAELIAKREALLVEINTLNNRKKEFLNSTDCLADLRTCLDRMVIFMKEIDLKSSEVEHISAALRLYEALKDQENIELKDGFLVAN